MGKDFSEEGHWSFGKTGMNEASWGTGRGVALLGGERRRAGHRGEVEKRGSPPWAAERGKCTGQSLKPTEKSEPRHNPCRLQDT